jgi:hypothetical protein
MKRRHTPVTMAGILAFSGAVMARGYMQVEFQLENEKVDPVTVGLPVRR